MPPTTCVVYMILPFGTKRLNEASAHSGLLCLISCVFADRTLRFVQPFPVPGRLSSVPPPLPGKLPTPAELGISAPPGLPQHSNVINCH